MKKEFFIFVLLLVFLALGMHMNQWISHPVEHFKQLMNHQPYHPFLYTLIVYLLLGIVRGFLALLFKLFRTQK